MVYIDRKRAKALDAFKAQVLEKYLQPYCSFIEQHHWSEQLLVQCYHDYYYQDYFRLPKQERRQNFWYQWQKLALGDPLAAGIFAMRMAWMEGMAIDPPHKTYQALQERWDEVAQHPSSRHPFFEPFIGAVLGYYQQDETQWTDDLKSGIGRLQQSVARKLTAVRNGLYLHALHPKQGAWKERYRLWQTLLMYDHREVEHLSGLPEDEYRQCDYWQVFTKGLKQNHRYQGDPLGDLDLRDMPLCPPPFRGQEILFPQVVTQLCQVMRSP